MTAKQPLTASYTQVNPTHAHARTCNNIHTLSLLTPPSRHTNQASIARVRCNKRKTRLHSMLLNTSMLRAHFLRERVRDRAIIPEYVDTHSNWADGLTKGLPAPAFGRLTAEVGVSPATLSG